MPSQNKETPRIYVACLAAYNAGTLHGEWLDLEDYEDVEALQEAIRAMLAKSPEPRAEEWAIHDFEGFCGIELREYEALDRALEIAKALMEHDDSDAVSAAIGTWPDQWQEALEEYAGAYDQAGDYAEQFAQDTIGESALGPYAQYIDWERVERDYELGGDITVVVSGGKRHIFRSF